MSKLIIINIIFVLLINIIPLYATENNLKKEEALNELNIIRDKYNIKSLENDSKLDKAATKHSSYMYRYNALTNIEEKHNNNYRGTYPWDRAAYYNYNKKHIVEFIDKDEENYLDSLSNFINNPYSRISLFDPMYEDIGLGEFNSFYSFELGGNSINNSYDYQVIYPYNNQTNIPIHWNNMFIDPYDEKTSETIKNYGLPITYTYYTDRKIDKIDVKRENIEVIDLETNKKISIKIMTPDTDRYLKNSIMILPLEPFDYNTKYQVNIKAKIILEDEVKDIETMINFKTMKSKSDNNTIDYDKQPITRANFTDMLFTLEVLDIKKEEITNAHFKDVPKNHVYSESIYTAYNNNIIYGYSEDLFGPDNILTREQLITMVIRIYDKLNKNDEEINIDTVKIPFKDKEQISSWALDSLKKAYTLKLVVGTTDNTIEAKRDITRMEAEIVLNNLKNLIK